MKKIFYFLNTVPEWIDVVKQLKVNRNWEPILWVTSEVLFDDVSQKFPNTLVLDLLSHRIGNFDKQIYSSKSNVLDKDSILEFQDCEKIVLAMMNRMDPTRHNFNYHQRVQLYYKTLIYWIYMFDKYEPDIVFFDEAPHIPFEYIMHEVARKKNVKIIRFNPTHINHRLLIFGELNSTPQYIKKLYNDIGTQKDIILSEEINSYYKKLKGTYTEAVPFYMKPKRNKIDNIIKKILLISKRILKNESEPSYQRMKNDYLENSKLRKYIKLFYRINGILYKKNLLNEYNKLTTTNLDMNINYIYVPLHFQPERTTSPDGDIFENQWLMIQLLSKTIPKGWKIYVKEHISQFRKDFSGEMGRNIEFYQDILLFKNVELVPLSIDSYTLIDNAKVVATVSGTVGIEAVVRDKRTMIFGHPWYEICEGVSMIKNLIDIDEFFKNTFSTKIDHHKVKAFFKLIEQISLPANHSGNIWSREIDKEINTKNLLRLIEKFADDIK